MYVLRSTVSWRSRELIMPFHIVDDDLVDSLASPESRLQPERAANDSKEDPRACNLITLSLLAADSLQPEKAGTELHFDMHSQCGFCSRFAVRCT
jgi:hypothetical protein